VPPLAGDGNWPGEEPAMSDHAAADPRAEDGTEDDGGAATGAITGLGQREAVRIVGEAHRPAKGGAEVAVEGVARSGRWNWHS